jgi:RNA polymerase sigma-70 factor (ECF subfamily)
VLKIFIILTDRKIVPDTKEGKIACYLKKNTAKNKKREVELVALLRKRDRQGLADLYDAYSGALLGLILRRIGQKDVAEEVLQDVFLKIWKEIEKYDPKKGALFTWMAQIANFTAIDRLRSKQYKRGEKTNSIENYEYLKESQAIEPQNIEDFGLQKLIRGLDEKHQIIIEYLYFKGYSQSEAAEALDIPLGTVKSRLRKAILFLRKSLGDEKLILILLIMLFLLKEFYF